MLKLKHDTAQDLSHAIVKELLDANMVYQAIMESIATQGTTAVPRIVANLLDDFSYGKSGSYFLRELLYKLNPTIQKILEAEFSMYRSACHRDAQEDSLALALT